MRRGEEISEFRVSEGLRSNLKGNFFDLIFREFLRKKHHIVYEYTMTNGASRTSVGYSLGCRISRQDRSILDRWFYLSHVGRVGPERDEFRNLDVKISGDDTLKRIRDCLTLEAEFGKLNVEASPDMIVFSPREVIVYEFKAGKGTLTPTQKSEFDRLKASQLPIRILIVSADYAFPSEYHIAIRPL